MAHNLYLVFSKPPTGVSSDEFHKWYPDHAQENIESPRFVSAQRYEVRRIVAGSRRPRTPILRRTSTTAPTRNGAITSRAACNRATSCSPSGSARSRSRASTATRSATG